MKTISLFIHPYGHFIAIFVTDSKFSLIHLNVRSTAAMDPLYNQEIYIMRSIAFYVI